MHLVQRVQLGTLEPFLRPHFSHSLRHNLKTNKKIKPFQTLIFLSELAAADRRGHVGGGGTEGS